MTKRKLEELDESELLYELLWKKHNAIDKGKVISSETLQDGSFLVKIGGKKMTQNEINNLQSEAKMIEGTRMWGLLLETATAAAEDSIFKQSKVIEDVHYGKAVLLAISIFKNAISVVQRPNLNKNLREVAAERMAKTHYQI